MSAMRGMEGSRRPPGGWLRTGARVVVLAALLGCAWGNVHGQEAPAGILLGQPLLPCVEVDDDKLLRILPPVIARDPIRRRDVAANPKNLPGIHLTASSAGWNSGVTD